METSVGRPLGRQVQLDLEFSDSVFLGVIGLGRHAPVPSLVVKARGEAGPLPIAGGYVVRPTYSGTTGPSATLPAGCDFTGSPLIRTHCSRAVHFAAPGAGEGFPSSRTDLPTVPLPLPRGVLRGCASRLFTASLAFAQISPARLPLVPLRG